MKKVLIVTYYWPPSAGSGVQRWLKFAKYLPKNGWKPVIYTPENPHFNLQDQTLLEDVPAEAEIVSLPIWEPYAWAERIFGKKKKGQSNAGVVTSSQSGWKNYLVNWIRGNLFIPDPRKFWVGPSVKFLTKYIKEAGITTVISTGPPHSMHLIGLGVKKATGIRWIADFRDPWSELDMLQSFHPSARAMRKYRKLEKKVITTADIVLTVSPTWGGAFRKLGANRVEVITNGYDAADFEKGKSERKGFVISHFGLFNHLRNPVHLWEALEALCSQNPEFDEQLSIHLGGTIDEANLKAIRQHPHLASKVKVFPYLSHEQVIREYHQSALLLLLLFQSESGMGNIPGKIFEYLAAEKYILGFGSLGCDAENIVKSTERGFFFDYNSTVEQLLDGIRKLYLKYRESGDPKPHPNVLQYSRDALTKRLSQLLGDS